MKKLLLTICAMTLGLAPALAQKPAVIINDKAGWHKIGETTVDFQKDHDEVAVLLADKFAALKFKVAGAPIELLDIDVFFTEGDNQNIRVGYAIKKDGDESRVIDLQGGAERSIKKIAFHYKTLENRSDKKAKLEIWGKKTNPGAEMGAGKNDNRGAGNGNNTMKDDAREVKNEARETKNEVKQDVKDGTREARNDTKETAREVKKETKEEAREVKKDTKKAAKKTEKKVKKESKELKKDAKEAKEDVEAEIKD